MQTDAVSGRADLLELVHAEDAASVPPVRAHLLPEAGGDTGEAQGQILRVQPLLSQEGRNGLLRRGDQVLLIQAGVVGLLAALSNHLLGQIRRLWREANIPAYQGEQEPQNR